MLRTLVGHASEVHHAGNGHGQARWVEYAHLVEDVVIIWLAALAACWWAWQVGSVEFGAGLVVGLAVAGQMGYRWAVRQNGMDMMRTGGRRFRRGRF